MSNLRPPIGVNQGGTGALNASDARDNLGLEIGVDVQAQDATLQSLSALGTASDVTVYTTGVDTWAETSLTPFARTILDDPDADTVRATIGAGTGSGTVTSVSGTVNRVSSTGGATPVIDIDAGYVGQTSITTLGTVTTGSWNATTLDVSHGGTGQTSLTNHGVLVGAATSGITQLAAGSTGQVLQSGGASADPAYSTATYPSTAGTSGNVLTSDGANWTSSAPVSNVLTATVNLTSAQIKALRGTPIQVIAAPGSGKVIKILSPVSKMIYGGTNVFTNGQTCALRYTNSTGDVAIASCMSSSQIINAASYTLSLGGTGVINGAATNYDNQPIVVHNTGASEITGNAANDNTVQINVKYVVETI